jgi:hypothetical protein
MRELSSLVDPGELLLTLSVFPFQLGGNCDGLSERMVEDEGSYGCSSLNIVTSHPQLSSAGALPHMMHDYQPLARPLS